MLFAPTHLIFLLVIVGFWIAILWAVITATKTLRRIATSLEQLARQKEEQGTH